MKEYEIYLPSERNDGKPVDPAVIERFKAVLVKAFGGYTHLQHRFEGAWRMGGVTFRDEVTIVRVLDDGEAGFDWKGFKCEVEKALDQEVVLIVEREVRVVG
jgi:hypothetical protein